MLLPVADRLRTVAGEARIEFAGGSQPEDREIGGVRGSAGDVDPAIAMQRHRSHAVESGEFTHPVPGEGGIEVSACGVAKGG